MSKILHIVGARPNYVKAAPVIRAIDFAEQVVVNTAQHYDTRLSCEIRKSVGMREPDVTLQMPMNLGTFDRIAFLIREVAKSLEAAHPDLVVVYGDVDSTMAATLVSSRLGIPVAHVESGLRSGDDRMPEELNRKIVDRLSSIHFVTEESGVTNLKNEGHGGTIRFVGNSMIDSLKLILERSTAQPLPKKREILLTCHRPSNVDSAPALRRVLEMCKAIGENIIWPLHPRAKKSIEKNTLWSEFAGLKNLNLAEPMDYTDFVNAMRVSKLVVTDSGGVQEETTYLGVPCLTLRENTERPSTVLEGTNTLVTFDNIDEHLKAIAYGEYKSSQTPPLWDGGAGRRIAAEINKFLN